MSDDPRRAGLDFSHVVPDPEPGASIAGDALRGAVRVDVTVPFEHVAAPALLGDGIAGTDRLVYVPRLRFEVPVVYVCFDPETHQTLYVGMAADLDSRRIRHEAEIERGNPGSASGSNMVPGAWGVMRADWFAVPVEAAYARYLEQALIAALKPVLQRPRKSKLNSRHAEALVAGGWTPAVARRIVELSKGGAL